MTFRISSLPPREKLFETRDLVNSPPPGAPGTEPETKAEGAVVLDLTNQLIRRAVSPKAPAEDPFELAARAQAQSRQDPASLLRAQGVPDAARVMALLFGD